MGWLVEAHTGLRWLVVAAGVVAVLVPLLAIARPSLLPAVRPAVAAYAVLVTVQVLLGVVLWVWQGRWDGDDAFLSFVHPVAMLLATGLAHAGLARVRRADGAAVARAGAVFSVISLVVVTAGVPTASWGM